MTNINSLTNPKIKDLVRRRRANHRPDNGLFIIDGYREIRLAQEAGWEITEIFYCPSLIKGATLPNYGQAAALTAVSVAVFQKIGYKHKPDGWLALAKRQTASLSDIKLSANPLVIIMESVEKPGNLGAIIRTAQAAGVDAVIINDNQTDIFNPNVIRASEGLVFKQAIVSASVEETIDWLKLKNIKALAAATSGRQTYYQTDLSISSAVILGSEAHGLSEKWLKSGAELVKIPMRAGIDSLNVSVSAAIIIYEALRQRGPADK